MKAFFVLVIILLTLSACVGVRYPDLRRFIRSSRSLLCASINLAVELDHAGAGGGDADVQRLLALRPPTNPATGLVQYDTEQASEYREALRDIVARYNTMEDFQEAARLPDPAGVAAPQLASAASPGPPGFTATPPAEVSLAQFAQGLMAPGPPPGAAGAAQNAGPPAVIPRRGTGTVL